MSVLLLAAVLSISVAEHDQLVAGAPFVVQLEVPEDVFSNATVEVRLLNTVDGTVVARKQRSELSPEALRFAAPTSLRRAALELWIDGALLLRVPDDLNAALEFEPGDDGECVQSGDGDNTVPRDLVDLPRDPVDLPRDLVDLPRDPVDLPCDLVGAALSGADLSGRQLAGADLSRADLRGARLSDANLSEADLTGVSASGADFEGANLSNAQLTGADLGDARLYVADLEGADLRSANLSGSNLTNANLANADLLDANLTRALLTGVEFAGARCPDGSRAAPSCVNHLLFE